MVPGVMSESSLYEISEFFANMYDTSSTCLRVKYHCISRQNYPYGQAGMNEYLKKNILS